MGRRLTVEKCCFGLEADPVAIPTIYLQNLIA